MLKVTNFNLGEKEKKSWNFHGKYWVGQFDPNQPRSTMTLYAQIP